MVSQNKISSFKIKRQAKNVFPSDVERTVGYVAKLFKGDNYNLKVFFKGLWYVCICIYFKVNTYISFTISVQILSDPR